MIGWGTVNEKLKIRLEKLKVQTKKHGPAILGVVGTIVASAAAVYYRNELKEQGQYYRDEYLWIGLGTKKYLSETGKVLKYRTTQCPDGSYFGQSTTRDDFSEYENDHFEGLKSGIIVSH